MEQGGNKWNPAINHQKFVEHLFVFYTNFFWKFKKFIDKNYSIDSTVSSLQLKKLLRKHFYHGRFFTYNLHAPD